MNIYLNRRIFIFLGIIILIFLGAYTFSVLYTVGKIALWLLGIAVVADYVLLSRQEQRIMLRRIVNEQLSLGDVQNIIYEYETNSKIPFNYELTDELPNQFQHRNYIKRGRLISEDRVAYAIRPVERGEYHFGRLHMFISSVWLGLLQRQISAEISEMVSVYPSIIQMKKFELQVFSKTAHLAGIRRVREIGENDEFEHIRNYVQGDNIRSINWKATSRRNTLMVNQYENSKSQSIYMVVDKGRSMKMPFYEMSLLDYAINSSLVLSNIILRKEDKVGLVTYSDKIGAVVKAGSKKNQLQKIIQYLYNQETNFLESNFELLLYSLKSVITRRSILMLFTNFEHPYDMQRSLRYLKALNRKHLLVVIIFANTELEKVQDEKVETVKDIYYKTFAQRAVIDKERIANELRLHNIQVILTKPKDLSINVVNKYLEIKAKRMR